jgi:hypothetical protein
MRPQLFGIAAAVAASAFPATPAMADSSRAPFAAFGSAPAFSGSTKGGIPVRIHRGFNGGGRHDGDGHDRDHHRRNHDRGDMVVLGDGFGWYGGQWALYNNRTFESDSYNDWWHDQPWRAYPRWMSQNLGCDRRWYSGDVLRC